MKLDFEKMSKQLTEFGLNPLEWTLQPEDHKKMFRIINRADQEFVFRGRFEPEQGWQQVQLWSI